MSLKGPSVGCKCALQHYDQWGNNQFQIIILSLKRLGRGLDTRGTVILLAAGTVELFHRHSVRRGCGAHPGSHTISGGGLFALRCSGRSVRLTPDLYLEPRLRMSGATPPLLYAFVTYSGRAGTEFNEF